MQVKTKGNRGFTLVEILIVAAIIALMCAIGIPNLFKARASGQIRVCIDNLRQIDDAKQRWALEHGKSSSDIPDITELKSYIGRAGGDNLPYCPNDRDQKFESSYSINNVSTPPQCQKDPSNHVLPP